MARARSLKPGFFANEVLAEVPPLGRLLFQGLWCLADRAGRLEDRPRRIKAEVLPYDDCDVDALLMELQARGFILRYAHGESRFIQVLAFSKHQNPHVREPDSVIPAPGQHSASTVPASTHDELPSTVPAPCEHQSGRADSPLLTPDSGLQRKSARARRASPPPAGKQDYPEIPDVVRRWAVERGFGLYLELHHAHFRDYLANRTGKPYADLDAAFRTCVRADWGAVRAAAQRDGRVNGKPPPPTFDPDRWWTADAGIAAQAAKLGIERRVGENVVQFQARVLLAAGEGPWRETNNVTLRRVMTEIAEKAA